MKIKHNVNFKVLRTPLVFLLLCLLASCATPPTISDVDAVSIAQNNETLKRTYVETDFTFTGVTWSQCGDLVCLSVADFRVYKGERDKLADLFVNLQEQHKTVILNFNQSIDDRTSLETALAYRSIEIANLRATLQRERTVSTVQTWVERFGFLGATFLLKSISK